MNTPPPAGNQPDMFSIATPIDAPDRADDDDGEDHGDAYDFEDAHETHEQEAMRTNQRGLPPAVQTIFRSNWQPPANMCAVLASPAGALPDADL